MGDLVRNVQEQDWKQLLASNQPVLVDFYATWCPPCKVLAPIVDSLAKDLEGKVTFAKVNIDESPNIANEFQIEGVPTLVLFKNGGEVDRMVGAAPKPALKGWIDQHTGQPA